MCKFKVAQIPSSRAVKRNLELQIKAVYSNQYLTTCSFLVKPILFLHLFECI